LSEKVDAEETGSGKENKAAPAGKEKLSRVKKRRKEESRKKRTTIFALALLLAAVLATGAVLDIPYINIVREAGSWVRERFSSAEEKGTQSPEYLFLTHPQSGRRMEGEVSVLLVLYRAGGDGEAQRVVMDLALFIYDTSKDEGEVYLIPESSVAYNAEGQQTELGRALEEEGGESLIRSTVGNLSGAEVDYLLLLDFWEAMRMIQDLALPPVLLADKTVLVNPVNGETNYLVSGQMVGDADRLLFYLLATDKLEAWEAFSTRLERAREYIPRALLALGPRGLDGLREMLFPLGEGYLLDPGTGSAEGDSRYLASVLQALAAIEQGNLAVRSVPAVEVLNGCGIPDLGRQVGERLASLGVPVAGTGGNAKITVDGEEINDFSHDTSTVIFRNQSPRVEAFANYLGVLLSVEKIEFEPGPGPEIIIIAGRDLSA
jgi:hypothetical protein